MSENNRRHHDDEDYRKARRNLVIILVIMTAGFMLSLLCGCKAKEAVTVEKTRTDTLLWYSNIRDSVVVKDSVYVKDGGDTVVVERWHTRWRERVVKDTVYKSRVDSVPYPVVKMVEKELSMWQKIRMHTGEAVLAILGGGVVWAIIRRRIFGG
jgi:hypothetical protein